jgi:hypothetical protein
LQKRGFRHLKTSFSKGKGESPGQGFAFAASDR